MTHLVRSGVLILLLAAGTSALDGCAMKDCSIATLNGLTNFALEADGTANDNVQCNTCRHTKFTARWTITGSAATGDLEIRISPGCAVPTQGFEQKVGVSAGTVTLDHNVKFPCGENVDVQYGVTVTNRSNVPISLSWTYQCPRYSEAPPVFNVLQPSKTRGGG